MRRRGIRDYAMEIALAIVILVMLGLFGWAFYIV